MPGVPPVVCCERASLAGARGDPGHAASRGRDRRSPRRSARRTHRRLRQGRRGRRRPWRRVERRPTTRGSRDRRDRGGSASSPVSSTAIRTPVARQALVPHAAHRRLPLLRASGRLPARRPSRTTSTVRPPNVRSRATCLRARAGEATAKASIVWYSRRMRAPIAWPLGPSVAAPLRRGRVRRSTRARPAAGPPRGDRGLGSRAWPSGELPGDVRTQARATAGLVPAGRYAGGAAPRA